MQFTVQQATGHDTSHLTVLEEYGPNCLMTPATAAAFRSMAAAAQKDGLTLMPASSHRSFERQLMIWNDKYLGDRPVLDWQGEKVDVNTLTGVETCYAILFWSALPGFSRHHWGTDIDVAAANLMPPGYQLQLTGEEYGAGGIFEPLTAWLNSHMEEFGFYRPFTDEAHVRVGTELWHISYRPDAAQFEVLITPDLIRETIKNAQIAGKSCLLGMADELYADYIARSASGN